MVRWGGSRTLWTVLACICLTAPAARAEDPARDAEGGNQARAAIYEEVFRWLAKRECNVVVCLLSVDGRGLDEALYKRIEGIGRVKPAREDDFIFENGAYRGFSSRDGRILDVSRVTWTSESEVLVDVSHLTTSMNSRACRYRLLKRGDRWKVDGKGTRCTIS